MVRIVAIATAALVCVGCTNETVLRIQVVAANVSAPVASLRVTLFGDTDVSAPRIVSPATLPGVIVVHDVPSTISSMCVEIQAFDSPGTTGTFVGGGSATVTLTRHATTQMTIRLGDSPPFCGSASTDDMGGDDMPASVDDLGDADGGAPPDMTTVAVCPPGAIFCDDFESGDFTKWSSTQIKFKDMGTVTPSMVHAAHGVWSARAQGGGVSGSDNYIELEKDFPSGVTPPLAVRFNVWTATPLAAYTMVMAFYDDSVHGFSFGGDNNAPPTYVMTEDQTTTGQPDRISALGTYGPGWHCVEVVIDAAGKVSAYVDSNQIIAPFPRFSAVAYTGFFVGIPRAPTGGLDVFVDDFALGPSRLYCPP